MFKRILVPLDGSERAERALPIAARLAHASAGSIFLVRVLGTEPASVPTAPARPLTETFGETDRSVAESYLEGVAGSELLNGISVHTEVPVGLVSPSILSVASNKYASIIVMCSHGYTGVKRWWMLGSVSAKVARFAHTPVFVLREGGPVPEERHPDERPLRILVPLDGSDYARAALVPAAYLATGLAAPGQGALHLTHIIRSPHGVKTQARMARAAQNTQSAQNMAREYLHAMVQQIKSEPGIADLNLVFTSSVTTEDDIAQGILRVAENGEDDQGGELFGGCDAIAMTTQGYSGAQPWVGSVTERVLETSRLPVMCVRPRE